MTGTLTVYQHAALADLACGPLRRDPQGGWRLRERTGTRHYEGTLAALERRGLVRRTQRTARLTEAGVEVALRQRLTSALHSHARAQAQPVEARP